MFQEILQLWKKPVASVTEKAEHEEFKLIAIKAGIAAAIWTVISVLNAILGAVVEKKLSYSTGKFETKWDWGNIGDAQIFTTIIKSLVIYLVAIALIAGIFFIISKLLKCDREYKHMLSIAANSLLIFAMGQIAVFIISRIYLPLGMLISLGICLYTILTLFLSFREIVGEIDLDKYTLFTTVIILVVVVILYFLLKEYIASNLLSSVLR